MTAGRWKKGGPISPVPVDGVVPQVRHQSSQIFGAQTRMASDPREHPRADFLTVMKRKYIVGPSYAFQDLMRTALSLNPPTDAKQGSQYDLRLTGAPYTHAGTEKTSVI